MNSDISLAPVRILDAPKLKAAGFFDLKVHEISSLLRETISDASQSMYIACLITDPEPVPVAFAGLSSIHPTNQNAQIVCRFSKTGVRKDIQNHPAPGCITTSIAPYPGQISFDTRKTVLDSVLRIAFFTLNLHRVSWLIPVTDKESGEVAIACGMRQEAVLEEALFDENKFVDAGMFSLLATEYPDYAVVFIAFPRGVLAVRGSSTAVEGIRFYGYGQRIEDLYEMRVAIRTGVSDETGVLLPQESDAYLRTNMQLPEELSKAVRELKEYFSKSRTKFSVRVNLPYGSDFQRHVWQELQKIPYGTTVSYEDIALALTGNDRVAARNLSRAVGSACSDNPIPILIPCHRVIGKDGRLVGFSGGVENKEFLLDHEILGFFRDVQ